MKKEINWYMGFDPAVDKVRFLPIDSTGVRGVIYDGVFEFERRERLLAIAISSIKIEIGL